MIESISAVQIIFNFVRHVEPLNVFVRHSGVLNVLQTVTNCINTTIGSAITDAAINSIVKKLHPKTPTQNTRKVVNRSNDNKPNTCTCLRELGRLANKRKHTIMQAQKIVGKPTIKKITIHISTSSETLFTVCSRITYHALHSNIARPAHNRQPRRQHGHKQQHARANKDWRQARINHLANVDGRGGDRR